MYKPSDPFYKVFTTSSPSTGAAVNADSLPVATANHNGADDGAFTLTVTNIDAGRYKITGTVPSGYVKGDVVNVTVAATVSTIAGKATVDTFTIDSKRIGDLNDSAYAGADTAGTTTLLSRVTAAVALASQIPPNFTTATFASAGVFSTGALANAPTGGGGGLSLGGALNAARALDSIADGSITLNDALWCAVAGAAGKEAISGTSYTVKTPSTGTTIRTFTLDSGSAPTSRT